MKFYLSVDGKTLPNQTNLLEIQRWLRRLVESDPTALILSYDPLFQGSNPQNPARPVPHPLYTTSNSSTTVEQRRFRVVASQTFTSPAPPGQIAFAANRIFLGGTTFTTPRSILSERDIGLGQIGNVFGHPVGRRALFNETAIVPTGVGVVESDGLLSQSVGEEGSYMYFMRIVSTGNATGMTYFYQRQPYWTGAFIPGEAGADGTSSAETYTSTLSISSTSATVAERSFINLATLLSNESAPVPSQIPVNIGYPTAATNADTSISAHCGGMAFDGLSRIWWVVRDAVDNGDAEASKSRSIWCWKRFTGEVVERKDAADNLEDNSVTGFPSLAANVQFRDIKATAGGFIFVTADGTDASSNGTAETGALIQINAATDTVVDVHGVSVAGIYTKGGLLSNDAIEVVFDTSETFTAAGETRVWVLHRGGLSYGDMNNTTGAIATWQTVSDAGADFNTIAAGSTRSVRANPTLDGANFADQQYATIDVDSDGNVYWVSTQSAQPDLSVNRLNKLVGDASVHTYYSLNTVAEGGAAGFIELGLSNGTTYQCTCLRVFRRDSNDPRPDDLWISGISDNVNTAPTIRRIEVSDWGTGNNLGAGYYQAELAFGTTVRPTNFYVSPDGSIILHNGSSDDAAILTSLNERTPPNGSGTGASFLTPSGSSQTVNLNGSSNFDSRWVQRQVRITGTSNAVNAGSFKILAVNSATQIVIENASGVAETSAFSWSMKGDEFETRASTSAAVGSLVMTNGEWYNYNIFPDSSGIMQLIIPKANSGISWSMNTPFPITHNYSGGNWYRAVRYNPDHGGAKTGHTAFEELDSGVLVSFANSGAGGDEFVADEYYTFGASQGLIKDPTQDLTYSYYGFFPASSTLIDTPEVKTASRHTVTGGFISNSAYAGVLTENPFVLAADAAQQSTLYQRQFILDGVTPNTVSLNPSGTMNNANGTTYAIDLGSDQVVSQLRILLGGISTTNADEIQYELFSATDAAGPTSWTLRRIFLRTEDNPQFYVNAGAFRVSSISAESTDSELIFDLGELATASDPQFGANTAARYWKLFIRAIPASSFAIANNLEMGNLTAFDAGGIPIGYSANQRLSVATDTDFLAVYPVVTVILQDDNTSAGGSTSRGPGLNQVTLNAGTFDADIGIGDVFRVLSGGNIVSSATVSSRDSNTQLTLIGNIPNFTTSDWEVVRNIDVRPRDDQGGNEDDPALPPTGVGGALQLYLDPITGYIWYSDDDISNTRSIRFEKYIKVSRTL